MTTSSGSRRIAHPLSPAAFIAATARGFALAFSVAGLSLISTTPRASASDFNLPQGGPGRALIYAKCRVCHDLQYVVDSKGLTPDAWSGLLDDMEGFGVELTPEERGKIQNYLATYMSNIPAPVAPQKTEMAKADGATVFSDNCTSCHQEDAKGIKGTFPPLAGNNDLFLSQDFPVKVLLNGMTGAITVNGLPFEGEMPPFDHLTDDEISALVNYLRTNFGNDASAHAGITLLSPDDIKALRAKAMEPNQVLAYRKSLK